MLPSNERLSRQKFQEILENKGLIIVFNKLGTLKYIPSELTRLSVVTSSKHEKRAVLRNKLRRRIYGLFKKTPIQGVFYVSKGSYVFPYNEIKHLVNDIRTKSTK